MEETFKGQLDAKRLGGQDSNGEALHERQYFRNR